VPAERTATARRLPGSHPRLSRWSNRERGNTGAKHRPGADRLRRLGGIIRLFAGEEARIAVSNVGDRGYEISPPDLCYERSSKAPPRGFCGKLTFLLLERFKATGAPLLILPCELVRSNGHVLRGQIDTLAAAWCLPSAFTHWLDSSVIFANTLVDRIVAEEIEPVGAIAEPYALWAIEERAFKTPIEHLRLSAPTTWSPLNALNFTS
jgi:mannitol-1-phosphate/altronate dehydrogenase